MIAIYKITNPKGRVYIGQTVNFKSRLFYYKNLKCSNQRKLYNSLLKYGFENHKIEILIECEESELNNLERYYQDFFNSTNKFGLNIRLTKSFDRAGSFSEESKKKMSIAKIGKKRSESVKLAISEKMKIVAANRPKEFYERFFKANIGRKHTKEHIEKNSKSKIGNKFKSNYCKNKKR